MATGKLTMRHFSGGRLREHGKELALRLVEHQPVEVAGVIMTCEDGRFRLGEVKRSFCCKLVITVSVLQSSK
eukprot:5937923-Amphidinium_carterae.1